VDWIQLMQDRGWLRTLVNTAKKLLVLQNDGEFLDYLSVLQVGQNKTEPTFRWGHF
jgi:hypothetical protein